MAANQKNAPYIGRFAPSPTGSLHFGSLLAAVASYLQAKSHHGKWLIRVEDIDPAREIPGSASKIISELARLGMRPDSGVLFQSSRMTAYRSVCRHLVENGLAFHCRCSRRMLPESKPYPGTCRNTPPAPPEPACIRIKVGAGVIKFRDGLQGCVSEDLSTSCGDFVIWRADDLPAYQLAVVLDDAFQQVAQVVRGADLLDSTARQVLLQQILELPHPEYIHIPVATIGGKKLSKQLGSEPIASSEPVALLTRALIFLGHQPPPISDLGKLWHWAIEHWDMARVPATRTIAMEEANPSLA